MNKHFDLTSMLAVVTAAEIFLASPGAFCVTGHTVMVNGGWTAA